MNQKMFRSFHTHTRTHKQMGNKGQTEKQPNTEGTVVERHIRAAGVQNPICADF